MAIGSIHASTAKEAAPARNGGPYTSSSMIGARTIKVPAAKSPDHAANRSERSISLRSCSCLEITQREMEGSRLKKYSHMNVCKAIRARCDAPNQPKERSEKMNPSRTVQKYHMKAQASSVSPMGAASFK